MRWTTLFLRDTIKDMTIKNRIKRIRQETPNCLEELFEMQNRLCDLCGLPIQDLICAVVEHSVPIVHFARTVKTLREASKQANDMKNLRCAHSSCNAVKQELTRDEWFARGLNNRDIPRIFTLGELENLRQKREAGQKVRAAAGGKKGGRTNASTPGFLSRIGKIGGHVMGVRHRDMKTGMFAMTPEEKIAMRQKAGRTNVASGHIKALGIQNVTSGRIYTITTPESCAAGGRLGGKTNVASGHMARLNRFNALRRFQKQTNELCSSIFQQEAGWLT